MPKASINGIQLHYQQTGNGPHVVLVHGVASNLALWHREFVPALAKQFCVTTYDLRGHGYSGSPTTGYTSADMATDLQRLLDHLGITSAYLVGHSFGGLVALHYAVNRPASVAGLVLMDTGIPAVEPERKGIPVLESWRNSLQRLGTIIPDDKADDMDYLIATTRKLRIGAGIPRRALPRTDRLMRLLEGTTLVDDCRQIAGLTLEKLLTLTQPMLLCYGDRSPAMATCRYLDSHFHDSRTVILRNAGHFHLLTDSQESLRYIGEFLSDDRS